MSRKFKHRARRDAQSIPKGLISVSLCVLCVRFHFVAVSLSILFTSLCMTVSQLCAEELQVGGHLKLQPSYFWYKDESISAKLGAGDYFSQGIDLRPVTSYQTGDFHFDFHAEMLAQASDELRVQNKIRDLSPVRVNRLNDAHRVFNLNNDFARDADFQARARVDRMSVGWARGNTVVKVGRQTITWGNGLLFPVLDVFNPFSPTEIDKDYKTGEDMVYMQELFESGDDLQLLVLPRRSESGGDINDRESSYATHYTGRIDEMELDYNLVAGKHYGNFVSGFGFSKGLLEGVARVDFLVDFESRSDQFYRGTANYDRSFVLFGFNMYAFLEYFYNSGGLDQNEYQAPDPELVERIIRGEVFTLGRDYLSVGGRIEWMALWNMYLTQISNVHDESGIFQVRNDFNIGDDWLLYVGVNLPYGGKGSEFGGIELIGMNAYLAPGIEGYIRIGYFF